MVKPVENQSSDLKAYKYLSSQNFSEKTSEKTKEGRLSTGQKAAVVGWALLGSVIPVIGTLFAILFSIHHYRAENKRKFEDKRISQHTNTPIDPTINKTKTTGTIITRTNSQLKTTQSSRINNPKSEPKKPEPKNNQISVQNNQSSKKDDRISNKSNQDNKAVASLTTVSSNRQSILDELKQRLSKPPIFGDVPEVTDLDLKVANSTSDIRRGLPNGGKNVCWMNSVLKILATTSDFDYLWNALLSQDPVIANLQCALVNVINELRDVKKNGTLIRKSDSNDLIDALKHFDEKYPIFLDADAILGKDQKDALKFIEGLCVKLTELLKLEDKCQNPEIVIEYQPVKNSEIIKYAKIENNLSILRVSADVKESCINLESHLFPEEDAPDENLSFDVSSNGTPARDDERAEFVRKFSLLKAPDTLAVGIERNYYDRNTHIQTKNNKQIHLPLDGKIRLWENEPVDVKEETVVSKDGKVETKKKFHQTKKNKQHTYQLESALVHFGGGNGGHWISYTRLENGIYLYHSDTYVEVQSAEEAMKGIAGASLLRFKKVKDDAALQDDSLIDSLSASSSGSDDDFISSSSDDDIPPPPPEFDLDDVPPPPPPISPSSSSTDRRRSNSI